MFTYVCFVARQLKCDRIRIHKNLFLSYILNGIVWIMYYSLAALNAGVLANNPVSQSRSSERNVITTRVQHV